MFREGGYRHEENSENKLSYYNTLGVPIAASQEEIQKSFRELSKQYHPDVGGDLTRYQEISEAYTTLKDPEKRAQYDASINAKIRDSSVHTASSSENWWGDDLNDNLQEMIRQTDQQLKDVFKIFEQSDKSINEMLHGHGTFGSANKITKEEIKKRTAELEAAKRKLEELLKQKKEELHRNKF